MPVPILVLIVAIVAFLILVAAMGFFADPKRKQLEDERLEYYRRENERARQSED